MQEVSLMQEKGQKKGPFLTLRFDGDFGFSMGSSIICLFIHWLIPHFPIASSTIWERSWDDFAEGGSCERRRGREAKGARGRGSDSLMIDV